jgi:hypothetical protein
MVYEEEGGWKEQTQGVVWVDFGISSDESSTDPPRRSCMNYLIFGENLNREHTQRIVRVPTKWRAMKRTPGLPVNKRLVCLKESLFAI